MPTEMKTVQDKQPNAAEPAELDPTALSAIRDMISAEQETAPPPPAAERTMRKAQAVSAQQPAPVTSAPAAVEPQPAPPPAASPQGPVARPEKDGVLAKAKARVLGYRPTPKHMMIAAVVLLVLFRPWLVVSLVLLSILAVVATFLILGYDGFWKKSIGLARWYARRRPSRAAELHRKLDDFAYRWDAFLDRFPEGTVDGLYLPDFEELAVADDRHAEAMDRRLAQLDNREA